MTIWEYRAIWVYDGDAVTRATFQPSQIEALNIAGKAGWELVGVCNGWAYLKRPVAER